jgi:hypothetical protein
LLIVNSDEQLKIVCRKRNRKEGNEKTKHFKEKKNKEKK